MLQICSGKLFQREVEYKNNLKGVIYTNLWLMRDDKIETDAGLLIGVANSQESNAVIYEVEELIENFGDGPGVLITHGIASYILDFSSILSFALNCTASPSYTLTERLLGDQLGVTTHSVPKKIVKQVFNKQINFNGNDAEFLTQFTKQLLGLERKTYVGVMNSIRTYVTGMQRIADDFELAYTLLVASIESLAQDFDGFQSTWTDYDQKKRRHIDEALNDADEILTEKIRNAILLNEHISLGKRFKEFSIGHINPQYYREEAEQEINPISRFDLPVALNNAYLARSKYIHNLQKLPKQLHIPAAEYSETCRIDNKTWFTLQGLSRLARHVITEFIMRQTTVEKESYDYFLERSNVMMVNFPPNYWLCVVDFRQGSGVKKLEGFLSQIANNFERIPNAVVSDLTELLKELETKIVCLKKEDKEAYLALYIIHNLFFEKSMRLKNADNFINKHEHHFFKPCAAALITNYLFYLTPKWSLEEHYDCLIKYFKERDNKFRFRCPKIFESGMILQLAERYRKSGNDIKANDLIGMAVENYPNHLALRQFEKDCKLKVQNINFHEILLPKIEPVHTEI